VDYRHKEAVKWNVQFHIRAQNRNCAIGGLELEVKAVMGLNPSCAATFLSKLFSFLGPHFSPCKKAITIFP